MINGNENDAENEKQITRYDINRPRHGLGNILSSPAGIYQIKVNRNIRTRCEICSKLTVKIPEGFYC